MPRLTVWMVRTALLHMGAGFTIGALMLYNKGLPFDVQVWRLLMPHIELMLLGWVMQLAMGVAFWILPRMTKGDKYGREWLAWLAYILLNIGILEVVIGHWVGSDVLSLTGRMAELAAAICFAIQIFPRIKAFGV